MLEHLLYLCNETGFLFDIVLVLALVGFALWAHETEQAERKNGRKNRR